MGFSYTGMGWITGVLTVFGTLAGLAAGVAVAEGDLLDLGQRDVSTVALVMAAGFVLIGLLNGVIGRPLNSEVVDGRRVWTDQHTYNGIPMQYMGRVFYTLAAVAVIVTVWAETNAWVGVLSGVALVVALIVRKSRTEGAQRAKGLEGRPELAAERGWRYVAEDLGLAKRMVAAHGKAARHNLPFGIVAGEIDGVPFTAFDTRFGFPTGHGNITEPCRRTTWLVHLPVELPAAWVIAGAPAGEQRVALTLPTVPGTTFWLDVELPFTRDRLGVVDCEDEAFAAALLTERVAAVTELYQFDTWQLAGRDLVRSVDRDDEDGPLPPAELAATADRLVALAKAVTADHAERFGTPPQAGIPYRETADSPAATADATTTAASPDAVTDAEERP
jgi:hypothetical protein